MPLHQPIQGRAIDAGETSRLRHVPVGRPDEFLEIPALELRDDTLPGDVIALLQEIAHAVLGWCARRDRNAD